MTELETFILGMVMAASGDIDFGTWYPFWDSVSEVWRAAVLHYDWEMGFSLLWTWE